MEQATMRGENVSMTTDDTGTSDQGTPTRARQDYGMTVVVGGKTMMKAGRWVTRKLRPRRAKWSR